MKFMCFLFILKIFHLEGRTHDPKSFLICTQQNCPKLHATCQPDNTCKCDPDYVTVNDPYYGEFQCNYFKKSQTIAFIMEFMIGFGVGHFYMGNLIIAILKLFFCFATIFIICFSPYLSGILKNRKIKNALPYLNMLFGLIFCGWQIFDGVMIGLNIYTDRYGMTMIEW